MPPTPETPGKSRKRNRSKITWFNVLKASGRVHAPMSLSAILTTPSDCSLGEK